jgi:hypothetical protein
MNLSDINPGAVRKYLYEYVLLALVSCVVYLFLSFNSLNEFIRRELIQQRVELVKTVEHNSNTINNFLQRQKQ